jgi:hypothetical protein
MSPVLIQSPQNKKKTVSKKGLSAQAGVIFSPVDSFVNKRQEQRSMDADVVQKKEGTKENINPNVGISPERY